MLELLLTGTQVVVAPSIHPLGERYLQGDSPVTKIGAKKLLELGEEVALASALVFYYPKLGVRHDYVLAATGYLGRRLPEERVTRIVEASVIASGEDEAHDRKSDIRSTLERLARKEEVTGGVRLDEIAPGLVGLLEKWGDFKAKERSRFGSNARPKSKPANNANSAKHIVDSNEAGEPWAPPAAFHSIQLPEFPRGVFPDWMEAQVEGLAEATQTPRDLSGMLGLGVGAVASARVVEVEVWPGWREPTNFYSATGMRSGSRKTTVFQRMIAPIEEYEADLVEETAEEIAEQRTKHKIYEERLKKAQTAAAKADGEKLDILTAEALTFTKDLESIKVPATPRLLVDDASPERLASILADQGGKIALMSPEGGVFDMMAGRYSQGIPNLDVYLKGHAGDALRVDRVGRPADHIRKPTLTISLAVQPDVFQGLASRPGFRGRGLIGRFAYAIPRDMLGRRTIRPKPVSEGVEQAYSRKVKKLLGLARGFPESEREGYPLRFDGEAQDEIEAFLEWVEPKLVEDAEFGDMTDWAGKLAGLVVRISGVLHMLDHAGEEAPWDEMVSADTVQRAIRIGRYLVPHAKYALAVMGTDPAVEDAKYILRWIERKADERFTKRDTFEGTKARFGKVAELEPGLELLVAHGYIREEPHEDYHRGPGRKPSPTYEINPLWVAEDAKIKSEHASQNSHYSQNRSDPTPPTPPGEGNPVLSPPAPEEPEDEMEDFEIAASTASEHEEVRAFEDVQV